MVEPAGDERFWEAWRKGWCARRPARCSWCRSDKRERGVVQHDRQSGSSLRTFGRPWQRRRHIGAPPVLARPLLDQRPGGTTMEKERAKEKQQSEQGTGTSQ